MAAAMARGWARSDAGPADALLRPRARSGPNGPREEVDGETRLDLADALRDDADVVLLAVKPAALEEVAGELEGRAPALLSVMAATSVAQLDRGVPRRPGAARDAQPARRGGAGRPLLCPPGGHGRRPRERADRPARHARHRRGGARGPDRRRDGGDVLRARLRRALRGGARAGGERNGLDPAMSLELVAGTLEGTAELLRERDPQAIRRRGRAARRSHRGRPRGARRRTASTTRSRPPSRRPWSASSEPR